MDWSMEMLLREMDPLSRSTAMNHRWAVLWIVQGQVHNLGHIKLIITLFRVLIALNLLHESF